MKIGELSKASSTPVETIRYYEHEGLLPPPARTHGNFRLYTAAHLARLQFVRQCRRLDMSLDEVRGLLRVKDAPAANCGDADALLDAHIAHVAARIRELRALQKELQALRQRCAAPDAAAQCGVLAGLAEAGRAPAVADTPGRHLRGLHARDKT